MPIRYDVSNFGLKFQVKIGNILTGEKKMKISWFFL